MGNSENFRKIEKERVGKKKRSWRGKEGFGFGKFDVRLNKEYSYSSLNLQTVPTVCNTVTFWSSSTLAAILLAPSLLPLSSLELDI